jgi:purine-binding chemotaxis protein CheW
MGDSGEPTIGPRHAASGLSLVCRVGNRLCALRLEHVVETMRPLLIEAFVGAPPFIRGISIIRGKAVPVVDAASLLGADDELHPTRLVTLATGDRQVALVVDAVLGLRVITTDPLQELPPLLGEYSEDVISAIGTMDAELLLVLRTARLVPESVWAALDDRQPAS